MAFTKHFEKNVTDDGCRYTFFCDICDSGYVTPTFDKTLADDAEIFAKIQDDAKLRFNRCTECGRWVCDRDYSIEIGLCSVCEEKRAWR